MAVFGTGAATKTSRLLWTATLLFLFFLPMGGAGYFGLKAAEPMFPLYVTLVNVPFGITIALVARAIIGKHR